MPSLWAYAAGQDLLSASTIKWTWVESKLDGFLSRPPAPPEGTSPQSLLSVEQQRASSASEISPGKAVGKLDFGKLNVIFVHSEGIFLLQGALWLQNEEELFYSYRLVPTYTYGIFQRYLGQVDSLQGP